MIAALRDSALYGIMPGLVLLGVIVVILAILYFVRRWMSEAWTRTRRPRSGSGSWRSPGSPPPEDLGVSEAGGLS